MPSDDAARLFERHRGRLLGLAYRMLGVRAEAEDVVQDAWLRWAQLDVGDIANAEAYLVRVTTRLSLDRLKSARAQREVYVGPWLPEPVADASSLSPHTAAELAEDLSFALLVALERLSPAERAAFLLHDVFEASYAEIAGVLEKSEPACRKLVSRARRSVRAEGDRETPSEDEHRRLLAAFVAATTSGDVGAFGDFLAQDAVAYSDGGGKVLAALNPIYGPDKIARFILGIARKHLEDGRAIDVEPTTLNGLPALLVRVDGELSQSLSLDVRDGLVKSLFFVRNPDKLARLAG